MKKLISVILCSLFAVHASLVAASEVEVSEFRYSGPYPVLQPLMIDSLDVNGKAFDTKSLLDAIGTAKLPAGSAVVACADLPRTSEGLALHLAGFTIENRGFASLEIKVEGVEVYQLYVDGQVAGPGKQQLEPATHEVIVEYLTSSDAEAAPKVSIETEKPELLTIAADTGARMYTLQDVIIGTRVAGIDISPDGRYLIATYRTNLEGGRSKQVTRVTEVATGKVVAQTPDRLRWLPTSTKYYFTRETPDGEALITVDPATGTESVWIEQLPKDAMYAIAPTEDFLLLTLRREGPKEREDVYEVIHPDDRQPGWRDRSALAKYDIATGVTQPLTFGHNNVYAHDISADGRKALISTTKSRLTARPTTLSSLFVLDLQTLETEALVTDDGFIERACFSPDGTQVLLSGSPECLGGIGMNVAEGQTPSMVDTQLYLLTIADGSVEALTKDFNPCVQRFEWSHADGHVYFTAEDRDCVHLFRLDGRTHTIRMLDVGEEMVKGFSLARSAQAMAFYGESATNCERVYTAQTRKMTVSLVRDLHAEQLSDVALAECKAWDFVNSRGDTICGRYYLPPHFDPDRKYPMIVNYYGGCSPTSRNFEGRYPHHAYAALGYVVYIVEPSGATGFGQEFSARHVATAGARVVDDIIEGTKQFCDEHSFVDKAKVGCIGASYGGFMTQWLQTKTDIFAAAVSHAGISDHTSYWGEGYWGYSYSEVSMANVYPWTDKELYVDQSPLYNADKIHTPLLFVHGDADHNVPVGESIQLYTALKLLGRETAMVLVQDQDHHILDYEKRIRWQSTIFAWFARYLQDDDAWWLSMYPKKEL